MATPTEAETLAAAEHVRYECDMLGRTAATMLALPHEGEHWRVIGWALIESHLLHRRNLIDWLCRKGRARQGRDVLIADFRVPGDWPLPEGKEQAELLAHKDELDYRLAHITYGRAAPELEPWDFREGLTVLGLMQAWASSCPDELPWHDELGLLLHGVELSRGYLTEGQLRLAAAGTARDG